MKNKENDPFNGDLVNFLVFVILLIITIFLANKLHNFF